MAHHVIVLLLLVLLLLLLRGSSSGSGLLDGSRGSGNGECLGVGKVLLDLKESCLDHIVRGTRQTKRFVSDKI